MLISIPRPKSLDEFKIGDKVEYKLEHREGKYVTHYTRSGVVTAKYKYLIQCTTKIRDKVYKEYFNIGDYSCGTVWKKP